MLSVGGNDQRQGKSSSHQLLVHQQLSFRKSHPDIGKEPFVAVPELLVEFQAEGAGRNEVPVCPGRFKGQFFLSPAGMVEFRGVDEKIADGGPLSVQGNGNGVSVVNLDARRGEKLMGVRTAHKPGKGEYCRRQEGRSRGEDADHGAFTRSCRGYTRQRRSGHVHGVPPDATYRIAAAPSVPGACGRTR